MFFYNYLPYISAGLCAGIAFVVFFRGAKTFAYRIFTVGMIFFAIEQVLLGFTSLNISSRMAIQVNLVRAVFAGLLTGIWLVFSLSFGRMNYKTYLNRWKWIILLTFVVPLVLTIFFHGSFFKGATLEDLSFGRPLSLGWPGFIFHIFLLLTSVVIIINLENILRASSGNLKWKIKFMALGISCLFAARIYNSSQALLFSSMDLSVELVNSGAGIVAVGLIIISLARTRLSEIDFYLSETFIFNSVTVFLAAFYLIAVGILAKTVSFFGNGTTLTLQALFVFIALIGLSVLLLSDDFRLKVKFWINRHLKRPSYDYREVWSRFSRQTVNLLEQREFCGSVVKLVSDTLKTPAVTIWLLDENKEFVLLSGSTVHSMSETRSFRLEDSVFGKIMDSFGKNPIPKTIKDTEVYLGGQSKNEAEKNSLKENWCCIPLKASESIIGFMTMGRRANGNPFYVEDLEFFKIIADQSAGRLLSLQFSEKLRETKQLEAFQAISAFFVHDLKNLANTLSLTLQNLPEHFDKPEFQKDALRIFSNSVDKINSLCGRLSSLSYKLELNRKETDLNALILQTIAGFNGTIKGDLVQQLQNIPKTNLDPDQIEKVLMNLIINAGEAVGKDGTILIKTVHRNGWVEVDVTDNGIGFSKGFIEKSLFKPFKTSKKKGLGIGLFQCKRIIEAHQGRIEVESEEGKGSTFRMLLPVK